MSAADLSTVTSHSAVLPFGIFAEITVVPVALGGIIPFSTVATVGFELAQVTLEPLDAVALIYAVSPRYTRSLLRLSFIVSGVTTVTLHEAAAPVDERAIIVVEPTFKPVTAPLSSTTAYD